MVSEVANKFAQSHFRRGVRDQNVRLLTKIVIQYIQVTFVIWDLENLKSAVQMRESANAFTKECFEKMFEHFISIVKTRYGFFDFLNAFKVHYDLINHF